MSRVESAASPWRKASRCDNGACVEVAYLSPGVGVRDNTQPDIHLTFDRSSWIGLLNDVRSNRFIR